MKSSFNLDPKAISFLKTECRHCLQEGRFEEPF
jgi:hypothetical protein